jgi:dihydrolipoamide dehydrogenase
MVDAKFDLIVIGGGPAGVTAALRARELGVSVALVERDQLGGTCTNDGCVPTRVLARAARLLRNTSQHAGYGLIGERPQLDFARLMSRTQQVVYQVHEKKQLLRHLETSGVAVYERAGSAWFIDPHVICIGDHIYLEADKYILCVGGHPRRLDVPGAEYALTHSDVWRLRALPRSMIIVGASATGCQLATVFDTFGTRVTILDLASRILPTEDESVSAAMTEAFTQRGVKVITEIGGLERIDRERGGLAVSYRHKDEIGRLEIEKLGTEAVIMAVGWPGNLDGLNLEAAGVATKRGYITVNDAFNTSAPHIFAAGDITGRMMLVQSATYEARVAVENAVLGQCADYRHNIVPHGGFTDPEYASVGLPEHKVEEPYEWALASYANLDRAVIDGFTEGFCKLIVSRDTLQLLGAHVVGEQAVEVVQLIAAGMAAGMTITQLAELELAYPTYTSIVGLAARRAVQKLGLMHLAPQWLEYYAAEWERRELQTGD